MLVVQNGRMAKFAAAAELAFAFGDPVDAVLVLFHVGLHIVAVVSITALPVLHPPVAHARR